MTTYYPVSWPGSAGRDKDRRYTVTAEYTGHESAKPRLVARFCGERIGDAGDIPGATLIAVGHACRARGCVIVTSQTEGA